ncbi:MAG: ROK family transcriptional regulator [Granulosicoccus sp.]
MNNRIEGIQGVTPQDSPENKGAIISGGGANLSRVRAHNERLVLSLVRDEPLPRAEIARRSGLSAQTITLITRDLTSDGLLHAGEPIKGKVGQPSVPLKLKADGAYFMGLKLGRRSAELIVMNFVGDIVLKRLEHYRYPTPELIADFMRREIPSLSAQLGADSAKRLHGIGIAMPYELWDWSEKLGAPQTLMDSWREFSFADALADVCDLPVLVENDATSACGAELTFGRGRQYSDFAYFFIGYFIGGGLAINGAVYRGQSGNAGAFGSLPVIDNNATSGVSQLIDTASIQLFENNALSTGNLDSEYIAHDADIWETDSAQLQQWLEKLANSLALAIVSISSIVDVGVIVIDGGFPDSIKDRVVAMTRSALDKLDTKGIRSPEIIAGLIGPDARALGAARLPLFSRFLLDETVLTRASG